MKKQFVLVGAIAVFGLGAFLVSCSKDDKSNSSVCSCTAKYTDGSKETAEIDLKDPDTDYYGIIENCSQLNTLMQNTDLSEEGITSVSCKAK